MKEGNEMGKRKNAAGAASPIRSDRPEAVGALSFFWSGRLFLVEILSKTLGARDEGLGFRVLYCLREASTPLLEEELAIIKLARECFRRRCAHELHQERKTRQKQKQKTKKCQ